MGRWCGGNVGTAMHYVCWSGNKYGYSYEPDVRVIYEGPSEGYTPQNKKTRNQKRKTHVNNVHCRYNVGMKVNHAKFGTCVIDWMTDRLIVVINTLGKTIKLDKKTVCENGLLVPVRI